MPTTRRERRVRPAPLTQVPSSQVSYIKLETITTAVREIAASNKVLVPSRTMRSATRTWSLETSGESVPDQHSLDPVERGKAPWSG